MKINYVEGDLFENLLSDFDKPIVLPHIVNNCCKWGSGFVVPLGRKFPEAREKYLGWCDIKGYDMPYSNYPPLGLGNTQFVEVVKDKITVANMMAQTLGGIRPIYYNRLSKCMDEVAKFALKMNAKIIAPMLGSGLAGGNWQFIEELIKDCWLEFDIPVNIYYIPGKTPTGWVPPEHN